MYVPGLSCWKSASSLPKAASIFDKVVYGDCPCASPSLFLSAIIKTFATADIHRIDGGVTVPPGSTFLLPPKQQDSKSGNRSWRC